MYMQAGILNVPTYSVNRDSLALSVSAHAYSYLPTCISMGTTGEMYAYTVSHTCINKHGGRLVPLSVS